MSFITAPPAAPSGPAVTFPPANSVPFGNATGTNLDFGDASSFTTRFVYGSLLSGANRLLEIPGLQFGSINPVLRYVPNGEQGSNLSITGLETGQTGVLGAGRILIQAQRHIGSGSGGNVNIFAGGAVSGAGGSLTMQAGNCTTGSAGSVIISTGSATSGFPGSFFNVLSNGTGGDNEWAVLSSGFSNRAISVIRAGATGVFSIGFFNAVPVPKPTGVAVTAAGIHAALVSLGLIAA